MACLNYPRAPPTGCDDQQPGKANMHIGSCFSLQSAWSQAGAEPGANMPR